MSPPEFEDDLGKNGAAATEEGQDNDSLASKLSAELSNWRRKRTSSRPRHLDQPAESFKSEPARTIKVRGHETLVVRKPKLIGKPTNTNHNPSHR
jgi:hypothetical protein